MSGSCIDTNLQPLVAAVQVGANFINPVASIIAGVSGACYAQAAALTSFIAGLNPLAPGYALLHTNCLTLQASFTGFAGVDSGGLSASFFGKFQAHTDFMSGKIQLFPAAALADITATIPGGVVLGAMSFAGLLGVVNGGLSMQSALCNIDAGNPCAFVLDIMGTIMGGFNAALSAIQAGFALMTDFANHVLDYVAQIAQFVLDITAQIVADLTNLIAQIEASIAYGLAKLLQALNSIPCFGPIISAIASDTIKNAIPPVIPL